LRASAARSALRQIDSIDYKINTYIENIHGFKVPNPRPPPGMECVISGCSYGTYSKSKPKVEQVIELTGKFILSGIRLDGVFVKINISFTIPEIFDNAVKMVSIKRNSDGLYYEDICVIKSKPEQNVSIDHIYVTNHNEKSLVNIFDFH
jgi:hypothetical protein